MFWDRKIETLKPDELKSLQLKRLKTNDKPSAKPERRAAGRSASQGVARIRPRHDSSGERNRLQRAGLRRGGHLPRGFGAGGLRRAADPPARRCGEARSPVPTPLSRCARCSRRPGSVATEIKGQVWICGRADQGPMDLASQLLGMSSSCWRSPRARRPKASLLCSTTPAGDQSLCPRADRMRRVDVGRRTRRRAGCDVPRRTTGSTPAAGDADGEGRPKAKGIILHNHICGNTDPDPRTTYIFTGAQVLESRSQDRHAQSQGRRPGARRAFSGRSTRRSLRRGRRVKSRTPAARRLRSWRRRAGSSWDRAARWGRRRRTRISTRRWKPRRSTGATSRSP